MTLHRSTLFAKRAAWCGLWVLLALGLLAASAQALAAPRSITIASYWQKLNDTQALAVKLESAAPAMAKTQLAADADSWAGISSVTLADGTTLPVDNSFLLAALRADPPNPPRVAGLAQAMAAAGASWPAPSHTAGDLAALSTILAQPDFQWPVAAPSWLDQLRERFLAFIARLLAQLINTTGLGSGFFSLGRVLAVVAVLAVAAVLAYALVGLLRGFAAEARAAEDPGAGEAGLTAEAASRRAQALAEGGDNRSAVRYLYLAALLHLEEAGLLRYDRSLTNREYLRSLTVASRPELAERLRGVVEVFDRVWYGFETLDAAAYGDYAARVAELRRQSRQSGQK